MLRLPRSVHVQMLAHALDAQPEEACGLLAGPYGGEDAARFFPCTNEAASSRVYTVEARDLLRADRQAQDEGFDLVGVMHSHTHTPPFPSPTDVAQAVDPNWHYLIVSLRHGEPEVRSFRIAEGAIAEEPVVVSAG